VRYYYNWEDGTSNDPDFNPRKPTTGLPASMSWSVSKETTGSLG
jgi:hypothetical protein